MQLKSRSLVLSTIHNRNFFKYLKFEYTNGILVQDLNIRKNDVYVLHIKHNICSKIYHKTLAHV